MKATKHSCYVCGDYNIDLLKVNTKNHHCEYFDEVVSQGFIPRIIFLMLHKYQNLSRSK